MSGYLAFDDLVWRVKNAAKTLVRTENVLSVFEKQKTEISVESTSVVTHNALAYHPGGIGTTAS